MDGVESATWRKSSYSGNNGGNCVEVAGTADVVLVRDTVNRAGPVLTVPVSAWQQFTDALR